MKNLNLITLPFFDYFYFFNGLLTLFISKWKKHSKPFSTIEVHLVVVVIQLLRQ